jgi:hypothetical protein
MNMDPQNKAALSEEWCSLFDLAAVTQGSIPTDIMEDRELVKALPLFFQTLRGARPTPEGTKS